MKKHFCLIVLSLVFPALANSSEINMTSFLENYFDSSRFQYEVHNIGGKEMTFAYRVKTSTPKKIFDKAIIFYNHDDVSFQPVLYITANKIITYTGELLMEGITHNVFYGWAMIVVERNNSFALSFYTNDGKNVTDAPTMVWDNDEKSFKEFPIDRSMW
jgi:hypothetical protein